MTYHEKHTELTNLIEYYKKEIAGYQDIISENQANLDNFEADLDTAEMELLNLSDEDEEEEPSVCEVDPNTKEYQEQAQQDLDDVNSFNQN